MARKARTTAKARGTRDDAPPDPAKEAQRRAREEFEQRMTAEAQARREAWAERAEGWASNWAAGGREQAERDAAERRRHFIEEERRKQAEEERLRKRRQERERLREDRDRQREREELRAYEAQRAAAAEESAEALEAFNRTQAERRTAQQRRDDEREVERLRDRERRRAEEQQRQTRNRERQEQSERDHAYSEYLMGIGAVDAFLAEMLRRMTALNNDPDYGIGDRKVFHKHTPPPRSGPRVFRVDMGPDPFAVLGLMPGASRDEVKGAYRKLALAHHPDRCGGDDREFIRIKDAYDRCLGLCA